MERPMDSFYEFMQRYPHREPERKQLAGHLKQLAERHPEIKRIDSLSDLMGILTYVRNDEAYEAVSGALWCTYCVVCNHPF